MGIAGIGVATIVAQFIGLLIIFNKVIKSSRIKDISTKYFYPKANLLRNLFYQSAPIFAALLLISVSGNQFATESHQYRSYAGMLNSTV